MGGRVRRYLVTLVWTVAALFLWVGSGVTPVVFAWSVITPWLGVAVILTWMRWVPAVLPALILPSSQVTVPPWAPVFGPVQLPLLVEVF